MLAIKPAREPEATLQQAPHTEIVYKPTVITNATIMLNVFSGTTETSDSGGTVFFGYRSGKHPKCYSNT